MPEPDASSTASDDALLWQIQAGAARILTGEAGAGGEARHLLRRAPRSLPRSTYPTVQSRSLPALRGVPGGL